MTAGKAVALSAALLLLPALAGGCKKSKDDPKDIGEQMRDVEADTQVMHDAQAAVNEVLRNQLACELAKPSIAAALMKLDEAERNVRTTASNATLDTLRKQVKNVQNACP